MQEKNIRLDGVFSRCHALDCMYMEGTRADNTRYCRLLGITRLQCAGLRDAGAIATGVYGCAGMYSSWTSTFWLGSLTHGLWQKPTEAKKSNINYHLSRFYPQIIGPHKRK